METFKYLAQGMTFYAVVFAAFCMGLFAGLTNDDYAEQANAAIKQCEAQLPRHLECEAVITAEVKE